VTFQIFESEVQFVGEVLKHGISPSFATIQTYTNYFPSLHMSRKYFLFKPW
jgi:hypothetical protein